MRIILPLLAALASPALGDACEAWQDPAFWQRSNAMVVRQCLSEDGFTSLHSQNGETPLHRAAEFADFPEAIYGFDGAGLDIDALNGRRPHRNLYRPHPVDHRGGFPQRRPGYPRGTDRRRG